MLEEMDSQEDFMWTIESAESIRSRYRVPTSCRSSSFLSWICILVVDSTFRISDIGFERKSDSASRYPPPLRLARRSSVAEADDTLMVLFVVPLSVINQFIFCEELRGPGRKWRSKEVLADLEDVCLGNSEPKPESESCFLFQLLIWFRKAFRSYFHQLKHDPSRISREK